MVETIVISRDPNFAGGRGGCAGARDHPADELPSRITTIETDKKLHFKAAIPVSLGVACKITQVVSKLFAFLF